MKINVVFCLLGAGFMNRMTFYLMNGLGPLLLLFSLANNQMAQLVASPSFDQKLFSFMNVTSWIYAGVFGFISLVLNFLSLPDQPTDSKFNFRTGTRYLFYENISAYVSIVMVFSSSLSWDNHNLALFLQIAFACLRWLKLSEMPFNRTVFNKLAISILFCEGTLLFLLTQMSKLNINILQDYSISFLIIGLMMLIGAKISFRLGKILLDGIILRYDYSMLMHYTQMLMSLLSVVYVQAKTLNIKVLTACENKFKWVVFKYLAFMIRHKNNCSSIDCPCHSVDSKQNPSQMLEGPYKKLSKFFQLVIESSLFSLQAQATTDEERYLASYVVINWLVNLDQNLPLAMTRIFELLARCTSPVILARLELIKYRIKTMVKARDLNSEDSLRNQQEFFRILHSERQFKMFQRTARKFINYH